MHRKGLRLALVAAVAVAACGGHAPTTPTQQPPPTDGGGSGTPSPTPPPTLKVTNILAFGDSITAGTTSPPVSLLALDAGIPSSYPFKLQVMETDRYRDQTINVWNAGNAGERAEDSGTIDRLGKNLSATHPDVLLLMEGANDLGLYIDVSPAAQRRGLEAAANAIEDMVRLAQGRGAAVFLATITPQRKGAPKGNAYALVDPYNTLLRTLASRKNATLVDVGAQFPVSLLGQDGLHPTEEGYQKLAQIFQDALAAAYEVAPATATLEARR